MPIERIEAFIRESAAAANGADPAAFEQLALAAFAFQFERLPAYRALCERRGVTPDTVGSWERVPMVPTLTFKTLELATDPPREVFRSSGTTSAERSVHHHSYPDLYRATIDTAFPAAALPAAGTAGPTPMLSLIPDRQQLPDSSLSFMVDHVLSRWADSGGDYAIGPRGIDGRALRSWLATRQRDRRPALILTTALALVEALDTLERLGVRFRLPAGSLLFETGGYKGRTREASRQDIEARVGSWFGIPARAIVREYGMTELTSQLYSVQTATATDLFASPRWVRARVLDAETLEPLGRGETGVIAIFDLANLGSAIHVLTEDLGELEADGLRLCGRASGAELRGCSLAAEELATG